MPSSTSRRLSRLNVPRVVLWAVSVVVVVGGYLLMTTSNAREAAVYTAGTADYPKLFAAQSGSTVGGLLIAVGVLGLLLALASLAVTRRPAALAEASALTPEDEVDLIDVEDEHSLEHDVIDAEVVEIR